MIGPRLCIVCGFIEKMADFCDFLCVGMVKVADFCGL